MSIGNALQIGRSALLANQAAIEVTGNNLANAATRGYHRQRIDLVPIGDQQVGPNAFVGRGVQISRIVRQVNDALEQRLRGAISNQAFASTTVNILSQIEGLHNELTDNDLSSRLGAFFNAWSELANTPDSAAQRSLVTQEGAALASFMVGLRDKLTALRTQVDEQIGAAARSVNDLLSRIADLNKNIAQVERGNTAAHSLRDQRDLLLQELGEYLDISTIELDNGMVDVFVGSLPVLLNGQSRGVEVRRIEVAGELRVDLVISADKSVLNPGGGALGGLLAARQIHVADAIDGLDQFARGLIQEVNRIHTQGQGAASFSQVTATAGVLDPHALLNNAAAGLAFTPGHGSFQIHVTQKSTGQRVASTIHIDLDGIDPDNDTTLAGLAASLGNVEGISATLTADGKLRLTSASNDIEFSFSDDTSGVLAALGINTFFSGSNASDIAVNQAVRGNPSLVASGAGHVPGDNRTALEIAGLRDKRLASLGNMSVTEVWDRHIEDFAVRLGQARLQVETDTAVIESLSAQQQSISGVNLDEEAINLLSYQRAYQGSARFLNVVDELMQTLLNLI